MHLSYKRIFEYFEVGNFELLLTEIIPLKIPVVYKGSTISTTNWMDFVTWHETHNLLDEIISNYSQRSLGRKMEYVRGVTLLIGYQFESADPPIQMFRSQSNRKTFSSSEKENVEFKMCPLKLVVSIYPLQISSSEIELPYFFVRDINILKGFLEKEVKERMHLSHLNKQKRMRFKPKVLKTSSFSKSDTFDGNSNDSDNSDLSIFNFSCESTLSSKVISSPPASENISYNKEFDCEVDKKQISLNIIFEDGNGNVESKNTDGSKQKINYSEENDFKITKKGNKRNRSKEKKEISSSRKRSRSKSKNSTEIKKKYTDDTKKSYKKNENKGNETKITRFFHPSRDSLLDSKSPYFDSDNAVSFNNLTQKAGNDFTSNPLKEVNNFQEVIKDKKLDNVKEYNDISTNLYDTLPDLLYGYEENFQKNDIKNINNFSKIIPDGSKDEKSDKLKDINIGLDSNDTRPYLLNINEDYSQGNEFKNINLEINEKISDESQLLSPSLKSSEHFSLARSTSSKVKISKPKGETSNYKKSFVEVSENILSLPCNISNTDSWTDSLPDLPQDQSCYLQGNPESSHCFTKKIKEVLREKVNKNHSSSKNLKKNASKSKHKIDTNNKHHSKKRTCNEGKQKPWLDSLSSNSSSYPPEEDNSYSKDESSSENSTLSSVKKQESSVVTQDSVVDNLEANEYSGNCKDKLVRRIYDDLRKLTIEDFNDHLEKYSSFFENIILGKIMNERDKKLFENYQFPRNISSELFIYTLDERIIDQIMEVCLVKFSSIMKSSGRIGTNITEVVYNMFVIIPELIKKALLSLPCAKANNITDLDCERIFFQLWDFSDENEEC